MKSYTKNPFVILGVIVVVLFGGAFAYSHFVGQAADEGVEVTDHVKGNPDSNVVLVEYADLQCPACAQFQPIVEDVLDNYGEQIRFEYRHFPLVSIHPHAEAAARAAEAAGQQDEFFAYIDLLYENQSQWSSSPAPSRLFDEYAEELGLNMSQFATHQKSSLLRDKVRSDFAEGQQRGITGTPTFFLNGERLQLQTINDLKNAVEAELGVKEEDDVTLATTTESEAETADSEFRFEI